MTHQTSDKVNAPPHEHTQHASSQCISNNFNISFQYHSQHKHRLISMTLSTTTLSVFGYHKAHLTSLTHFLSSLFFIRSTLTSDPSINHVHKEARGERIHKDGNSISIYYFASSHAIITFIFLVSDETFVFLLFLWIGFSFKMIGTVA